MNKIELAFGSRTIATIVVMFVVGGGNAIIPVLPISFQALTMAVLAVLAGYFHLNPSQNYTPTVTQ